MKKKLTAVVLLTAAFCVYADISFENPNLNDEGKLLFSVNHKISGSPEYAAAFLGDAASLSTAKILTCYPEKMELLSKGSVLQVRNRWGTARWNVADQNLAWVSRTDSIPVYAERQLPQSVSPDGKWICAIKKTGAVSGELVLKNASTLQETVLNKNASLDYEKVPVHWNPDSSSVLYEKDGVVYFCDPKAAFQKVQLTESYRKIGRGTIASVYWANSKTLIYIDNDLIYRINSTELYTRGLYSDMVGTGTVTGRLPVSFNGYRDSFSVNQTVTNLVLIQSNKIASLFYLEEKGFEYLIPVFSKTITDLNGNVVQVKTFWNAQNECLLWIDVLGFEDGNQKTCVAQLGQSLKTLAVLKETGDIVISEDGRKGAFSQGTSVFVYDLSDWKLLNRLDGEKVLSYIWSGNDVLFVGGESTVRQWNIGTGGDKSSYRILFLSACSNAVWNSQTSVCGEDPVRSGVWYDYDMTSGKWSRCQTRPENTEGTVQNGKYRVFTGNTPNKKFSSTLYVRTLSGKAVTKPYFPETAVKTDANRKICLVIDALDDSTGLSTIISVLNKYKIPATFFVNGEFIRRYPKETRQIVKSGFDCGAMFFTSAELTAKGFLVDENFIRRGLARNEDEFFQATDKELSLIWHAPFYKSNQTIKNAGKNCGYRYVEAGRFSLDTVTLEDAAKGKPGYLSASELISFYAENATDGSIIPVSAGLSKGTRSDYLYEKIDLLIESLLNEGFDFSDFKNM
jgi:hypothetical protein